MEGGRIKKIKIRNFMTYDDVELYPKKGLNLIVGLNGSGKSSIMCAISLGLAGKPHFTGRATHLSDFIKHGCQEAEIEIELEKAKGSLLIRRKIKGDKCEWFLNRAASNHNEVVKAVKCCNIDTSNLCQFLPQEKVMEFSRMDKKQRLENMLQTIGEPRLFELFNELKDLDKGYSDVQQNLKRSEAKKNSAEEENERISDEVKKQESRVRLKKELDDLFNKRKVVEYENVRNEVDSLKAKMKNVKAELVALKEDLAQSHSSKAAVLNSYMQYSKQKQEFVSQRNNVKNKITAASDACRTLKEQAENESIEYKNRVIEMEDEQRRLHDLNEQIEGIKQYLIEGKEKLQQGEALDKENTEKLARLQLHLNSLYEEIESVSVEKNQIDLEIQRYENQLAELRNEHNRKMENLKRRDRYTYQAACWLQANRNLFVSNVYMPIMMEIKVHSNESCKYVESSIPFRDMIAFVCENPSDYEKFTDIVAQKEWPVNVVMPPDTQLTSFTSPPLESQYKMYGLQCYVSDLFTAPEPILRYLFSCYGLHRIPVAATPVSGQNINPVLMKYRSFFSGNYKIVGRISRYGNRNMSQKKDYITDYNLLTIHNDDHQNNVVNQLQSLREKKQIATGKMEVLESQRLDLEKKQELIRSEKKLYQEFRRKLLKHEESYRQKVRSRAQIASINMEEEKLNLTRKIRSINKERMKMFTELNKLFKEFVHFETEIIKTALCMNSIAKSLRLAQSENDEVREKVKATEVELQNVQTTYRDKKNFGKLLLDEIRAVGELSHVQLDSEEIEEKISHIQAQLSVDEDNEPLVADYNARKIKIETYRTEISNILSRLETMKEDIEEKKAEWLTALQKHIENINKKFSHYFKQLNCAGEINLDIPDNPYDFGNYGLQIQLKFRDEEPLVELSQTRHSGGECSVAAIVFILSLQELTEVPFRCIDEINQGMDSINERKIYQLIADSVGDDRCSQYFLLTPKLLPDLQYPEDVAVHIIFNSCFLNIKLDVKKHLSLYQAL